MKFPADHYTPEECLALMSACGESWVGRRNRALIVVLWRTGLRLSEALALTGNNIDRKAQTVRVLHGKGDKARTVGIDLKALAEVEAWLADLPDPSGRLFVTRTGKPLLSSYVRAMLPRLAQKAGVTKRVHAHGLRHTFAVELAQERVPMTHIQRMLGHSSLATTSIYLASLSPEEALDAIRGREW